MVKTKPKFPYLSDGSIDIPAWIDKIKNTYQLNDLPLLIQACILAQDLTQGLTTFYGQACLEHGLETAEIIFQLKLDQETAAAAIISTAVQLTPAAVEIIRKKLGETILKLAMGVQQIDMTLQQQQSRNTNQIDKIRKMILAMATDIRMVIIKLAERLCLMRGIKAIPHEERKRFAQSILDIYAPLANRLGIGQLKWELEDLAFHYLDPVTYKTIAKFLAERRDEREARVQQLVVNLKAKLDATHIAADVTGRAKHIYSIYAKSHRKELSYEDIYDQSAVRILVPTIQDCYEALSIVHSVWQPIEEEFDDYIAHPKPNGYRSIHTAVIGEDGKHFEIQIRTHMMHEEAERGVAAHWAYKENRNSLLDDTMKISYLRQLLDWHKEIAKSDAQPLQHTMSDNLVYVMTPAGDIIDLPQGATPIDFAYHVHSELGHRCRGAKVNGQIVPLNYALRTGDKIEINTIPQGGPSRDWLNPELNFVKTSRARSKIAHWFKQQELSQDIAEGRQLLERELARNKLLKTTSLVMLARHFNLKDEDALLAAVGRGNIRPGQIQQALQPKVNEKPLQPITTLAKATSPDESMGSAIMEGSDLLTRLAKCCKPIPGDLIIGYITQGRGISIHKKNCKNLKNFSYSRKFIHIHWENKNAGTFNTDLKIITQNQTKILNDLTALLANEKIYLLNFQSTLNENQNKITFLVTVQIHDATQLQRLLHQIQQLPGVVEAGRI